MDNGVTLELIEDLVRTGLAELGTPDLTGHRTTLLIQDGYFVGRRFIFDGVQAVWLTDEQVVRFYDADGQVLKTVALDANHRQDAA